MIEPITVAITQAVFIKGLKKDVSSEDIKAIAQYVRQYITLHKPLYRIGEIVQAIELGSLGELSEANDQNGLSPEIVVKWIHRFHEKFRKEALHKQRIHEGKLEEAKTEEKRIAGELELKSEIERIYADFLKNKPLKDSVNNEYYISILSNQFVFLEKLNMIALSGDIFLSCGARALKQIEGETPSRQDQTAFNLYKQTKQNQALNLARYFALEAQFELWQMEGKEVVF